MTLSKIKLSENADLALRLMMEELGDEAIDHLFQTDTPRFANIYSTTWQLLEDQRLVKRTHYIWKEYKLTGPGWLKGLEIRGARDEPEMQQRVGKVMAELKKRVDARQEEANEYLGSIATGAGMPENLLFNIIESNYIEIVFRRKGVQWDPSSGHGFAVVIPVDFGRPL
jgi:hypothetical protein